MGRTYFQEAMAADDLYNPAARVFVVVDNRVEEGHHMAHNHFRRTRAHTWSELLDFQTMVDDRDQKHQPIISVNTISLRRSQNAKADPLICMAKTEKSVTD